MTTKYNSELDSFAIKDTIGTNGKMQMECENQVLECINVKFLTLMAVLHVRKKFPILGNTHQEVNGASCVTT